MLPSLTPPRALPQEPRSLCCELLGESDGLMEAKNLDAQEACGWLLLWAALAAPLHDLDRIFRMLHAQGCYCGGSCA